MKKLILVFSIACLFISCETKYYSVSITNDSKKRTVSYTYNGSSDTLDPGDSKTYEVKAYTQTPTNIKVLNYALSVTMNQKGDTFTFVDVEPIIFNVVNSLPVEVTIKADNYIWDSKDGKIELSVPPQTEIPNEKRPEKLFIYTEKPKFTITSDYSVKYEWNITDLDELDDSENPVLDDSEKPKKKLSLIIR